ncbi:hypothetical protein BT69DRAFT_1334319 [Atractiella rhizophila]|nr:hypothetical protein BT69DRAFT_1334319 [Atractiella rhizophila]
MPRNACAPRKIFEAEEALWRTCFAYDGKEWVDRMKEEAGDEEESTDSPTLLSYFKPVGRILNSDEESDNTPSHGSSEPSPCPNYFALPPSTGVDYTLAAP